MDTEPVDCAVDCVGLGLVAGKSADKAGRFCTLFNNQVAKPDIS